MRTPRLPVVDWTDATADLNGLVRFAERRNITVLQAEAQLQLCFSLQHGYHSKPTTPKLPTHIESM